MGASSPPHCALILVTLLLLVSFVIALIGLITPEWAKSSIDTTVGFRLNIKIGLMEQSCDSEKLDQDNFILDIVNMFVPVDELCDQQMKKRATGYQTSTIVLISLALVLAVLSITFSSVGHCWPNWLLLASVPFMCLIAAILQITALVVFITNAKEQEPKVGGVIKSQAGEQGYSMMLSMAAVPLYLLAVPFAVWAAFSAAKSGRFRSGQSVHPSVDLSEPPYTHNMRPKSLSVQT